jgi:hypothetical protein
MPTVDQIKKSWKIEFQQAIEDIETSNVYDTSILINDLKNIPEIKAQKGFFQRLIESILGSAGDLPQKTDAEWFFSELENTPLDLSTKYIQSELNNEEFQKYFAEVREYLVANKEELLITLRDNTLKRFFKNETKNKIYQKLSRLNSGIPLMMKLREFLYNIYSVKKLTLNYLKLQIANAFLTLKILYNGNKIQDRFFMLAH